MNTWDVRIDCCDFFHFSAFFTTTKVLFILVGIAADFFLRFTGTKFARGEEFETVFEVFEIEFGYGGVAGDFGGVRTDDGVESTATNY